MVACVFTEMALVEIRAWFQEAGTRRHFALAGVPTAPSAHRIPAFAGMTG